MVHYLNKDQPVPDRIAASKGVFDPTIDTSTFRDESDHLQDLTSFDFDPADKKGILDHRETPMSISKKEKGGEAFPVKLNGNINPIPSVGDEKQKDPEGLHLLEQIADGAIGQGYQVFSNRLENAQDFPIRWDKPIPDLLIRRMDRTIAYLYVSSDSIKDGTAIKRWEEFSRLQGFQVRLVIKSRKLEKPLSRIQKEKRLQGRIVWLHRKRRISLHGLKERMTLPNFMILASAVIVMVFISFLVSGSAPNFFQFASRVDQAMRKQTKINQPRDVERQKEPTGRIQHSQLQ